MNRNKTDLGLNLFWSVYISMPIANLLVTLLKLFGWSKKKNK